MARVAKKSAVKVAKKRTRPLAGDDEKPQGRREFIRKQASMLFSEYGYSAATMDQLSEQTGLNKGTLYYYYESKADILFDICFKSTTMKLNKAIKPALKMEFAVDALSHFITVLVERVIADRDGVRVYVQEVSHFKRVFTSEQYAVAHEQQLATINTLKRILQKGAKNGEFQVEDSVVTAEYIMGMLLYIYQWADRKSDPAVMAKQATHFILNGLSAK